MVLSRCGRPPPVFRHRTNSTFLLLVLGTLFIQIRMSNWSSPPVGWAISLEQTHHGVTPKPDNAGVHSGPMVQAIA